MLNQVIEIIKGKLAISSGEKLVKLGFCRAEKAS